MAVFSRRIELNRKLKLQQEEIQKLKMEREEQIEKVADQKRQIVKLTCENEELEKKYVDTGLECEFCYSKIQKEFAYCPKCGRKIVKSQEVAKKVVASNIFQTENDLDGLLINQYNGFFDKRVVIPSFINGKPVIGIWNSVFENCVELEEVVFEEGCRYIGKDAFSSCSNLKKVRLPKSLLEIGDGAFRNCAIEEIAVPPNVKVIGDFAFADCSLKKILLPDDFKYLSAGMLARTLIEEIDIPQSIVHIGYGALKDTKIEKIELPYNLYSIGENAFEIPGLKEITIHSNVKEIGKNIFGEGGRPVIFCSAGSKAHLLARKYGIAHKEIQSQPVVNVQTCVSCIILTLKSLSLGGNIADWYPYFNVNKAETWSWYSWKPSRLEINKYMDREEALRLKDKLQEFVNCHSDWSASGIHCSLEELVLCDCEEYSVV